VLICILQCECPQKNGIAGYDTARVFPLKQQNAINCEQQIASAWIAQKKKVMTRRRHHPWEHRLKRNAAA
jgi:hypothetical protein